MTKDNRVTFLSTIIAALRIQRDAKKATSEETFEAAAKVAVFTYMSSLIQGSPRIAIELPTGLCAGLGFLAAMVPDDQIDRHITDLNMRIRFERDTFRAIIEAATTQKEPTT